MYLFRLIQRDFKSIPFKVKWVVLMFSLWVFGWGFADPLFSLYLQSIIPNYAIIGILSSMPHLIAMLLAVPIGELEDHIDSNLFLKYGLLGYVLLGFAYTFAGFFKLIPLLVLTLLFHGFISSIVIVSARTYVKKKSSIKRASMFVGLLNMFYFGFYGFAMFLGFYAYKFYNLNTVFLVVSLTSFLAYLGLCKVFPANERTPKAKKLFAKIMKFEKQQNPFKKVVKDFSKSGHYLYYALMLIFFVGLVETMIMIFVPLFANEIGLGFGKISLLMGMMYLPYVFSFLFAEIADRYEKMNVSIFGLTLSAFTMFFMYFVSNNALIAVLSALIAVSLALINPVAEGILTSLIPVKQRGEITGLSSFFYRIGKFIGPFSLGFFANIYGINSIFLIVAFLAIILAIFSIVLKYKMRSVLKEEIEEKKISHRIWEILRHPLKH